MRKIAVILGSKTDLPQCVAGLKLLKAAIEAGEVELYMGQVIISSIHRATDDTLNLVSELSSGADVDVLITGAGWANHLTGVCDSYLRYGLDDAKINVIGVAFEDPNDSTHTATAIASIIHVPKTKVIYQDANGIFCGGDGFARACQYAVSGELPEIKLPEPVSQERLSLDEAIAVADAA
jgi:phosphoribosylcarboxyaminoimidazole (NCAIR) mutase